MKTPYENFASISPQNVCIVDTHTHARTHARICIKNYFGELFKPQYIHCTTGARRMLNLALKLRHVPAICGP